MPGPVVRNPVAAPRRSSEARDVSTLSPPLERAALVILALVVIGAGLLVDPAAEAAFDVPKRLACLLGVSAAAACLLPRVRIRRPAWSPLGWVCAVGFGAALVFCCVSAVVSPHPASAPAALRGILVFSLLVPLGASRLLAAGRARLLALVFLAVASVNAVLACGERWLGWQLLSVEAHAGRAPILGLIGNEGCLGLALSFAAVIAFAGLMTETAARSRLLCGAVVAVNVAGVLATAAVTALLALAAGIGVVLLLVWRARGVLVAALGLLLLAGGVLLLPATRARSLELWSSLRSGDWDRLTTYRLGAWAAALEMAGERPLFGYGPGSFAAEFARARTAAELRFRRRLAVPQLNASFGQAHSEPLQALAEGGGLAAASLFVALLGLIVGLMHRTMTAGPPGQRECQQSIVIVSLLASGIVASLSWFPLQIPLTAVPLLLAAGRGFRCLASSVGEEDADQTGLVRSPDSRSHRISGVVALLWLAAIAVPEGRRLRAEHALREASSGLRAYLQQRPATPSLEILNHSEALALSAASDLPGDSRPWLVAGAARLAARQTRPALEHYCHALSLGERAEIDLNIGRALAIEDDRPRAFEAFMRAAWLSPALMPAMPNAAQPLVERRLGELGLLLTQGDPAAIPPSPRAACNASKAPD